jgi:hypothetical protein
VSFQRLLRVRRRAIYGLQQITKEFIMNWVFETYSNVYSTAMMQDTKVAPKAIVAHKPILVRLFGRG